MTAFITRCWKKARPGDGALGRIGLALLLVLHAQWAQAGVAIEQLRAERQDKSLLLQAHLKLDLGPAIEEALRKGVAVHFVAEATLVRERWYWTNQKLSQISRYYRLSFQPLTRQWRLQVSTEPLQSGVLAGSLAQSFESLQSALDVIGRQAGWPLADLSSVDPDAKYELSYNFRLDVAQLPRPFQFAIGNQSDWNLNVSQVQALNLVPGP